MPAEPSTINKTHPAIDAPTSSKDAHAHYLLIAKAIRYLAIHQTEQPSLKTIADDLGMSEFHFQRVFTEWAGVSPKQFLLYLTKESAKKTLREASVLHASIDNGLSSPARLHDLFITHESVTPGEYKKWGQGVVISYGIHSCMFGFCFLAATSRGVCKLAFFDNESEKEVLISELQEDWSKAVIQQDNSFTDSLFKQIFCDENNAQKPIHLLLKGTPFKLKVWEALLSLRAGQLSTYSHIAEHIQKPKAVRAVASAIASNQIALIIPCHRVIRNTGALNEYRWGKERKAAMIAYEQSKTRMN